MLSSTLLISLRSYAMTMLLALALIGCGKAMSPAPKPKQAPGRIQQRVQRLPEEGNDITSSFVQSHLGIFIEPEFKQSFKLEADEKYSRTVTGQVGSPDTPEIPPGTICSYRTEGKLLRAMLRNETSRENTLSYATHLLVLEIHSATLTDELTPGTTTNPGCQAFLRTYGDLAHAPVNELIFAEIINRNNLRFHESGGEDYAGAGTRPASTFDEHYVRE